MKYEAIGKQSNNVVIISKAVDKTETRIVAERSLIAAMTSALVVAVSTYRLSKYDAEEWTFPSNATDGARELHDLMEKVHEGRSMFCVPPCLQINMDDQTQVVYNGLKDQEKDGSRTMHKKHFQGNGTRAPVKAPKTVSIGGSRVRQQKQNAPLNPQRIKSSWITNACGASAEAFYTISGLAVEELPADKCPSGFLSLKVHGLGVGADTDPFNSGVTYLNFMRKGVEGAEESRYALLRSEPLHRFVDRIRFQQHGVQSDAGLMEQHTAVVSSDGDLGQISCIRNEERIAKERQKKICSWKHNPARTSTEQANDLGKQFPEMNRQEKSSSLETETPEEVMPLLNTVKEAFEEARVKYGLNLPLKRKKTLMQYLARMPGIRAIAATKRKVQHGYFENGQIDRMSKMVPDLKVMIQGTLRRDMHDWEWSLVRSHFVDLARVLLKLGHIPDKEFIDRGFPADLDLLGEEVFRPDSVTQEHLQRAKIMDHPHQVELRARLERENRAKENEKTAKERALCNKYIDVNRLSEKKLLRLMGELETSGRRILCRATLENFAALKSDELKAFAFVRKHDIPKPATLGLPKNKGKLEESREEGANTLIRAAFDLRKKNVKLKVMTDQLATLGSNHSLCAEPVIQDIHLPGDFSLLRFTLTEDFVSLVKKAFDPFEVTSLSQDTEINLDEVQTASSLLHDILQERLTRHIQQKVEASLSNHWVWRFTRVNIGRVAAAMVLMQHIKADLEPAKWRPNHCLLQNVSKGTFVLVDNQIRDMEGNYLIHDRETGRFIRTGKTCNPGRSFAVRYWGPQGHEYWARKQGFTGLDSRFCSSYPARSSAQSASGMRRGYFEDLELCCGLGFYRDNKESLRPLVETQVDQDSIFSWESDAVARIQKAKIPGTESIQDKQLHVVACLCEICYELTLSPDDNVSVSQGYEVIFGKSGKNKS